MRKARVAVILPCLNEEMTIGKVVKDFRRELPDADIYVFDNMSTDNTRAVASAAGASVFVSHTRGKGAVMRHAMRMIDADFYLFADGDDTYPAEDAYAIVQAAAYLNTMVTGSRLPDADESVFRPCHLNGNKLVTGLVSHIWGEPLDDVMTGYRCIPRPLAKTLLRRLKSDGFEIETEITIETLRLGKRIYDVPIIYGSRPAGSESKLRTVRDGTRVLCMIIRKVLLG